MCFLYSSMAPVWERPFIHEINYDSRPVKYLLGGYPLILGNRERYQCGGAEWVWNRQLGHHCLVSRKLNHFPILCFARFWVSEGFCISRLRQWCPKALVQVSGFLHGSWDSLQKLKNDSSVDHFWGLFRSIENIIYLPWNKGNICFIWECPNCSQATSKISIFFFPRTAFKKGVYFLHCQEQSFHLWETWEL